MNGLTRALAAGIAAAALGAAAAPALAATHTLSLTGPTSGTVGQPLIVQASGVNPPPSEWWNASWLSVDAIPASVVQSCPLGALDGSQVASNGLGKVLAIALPPNSDAAGNFSNAVAFTPWAAGTYLLCGYSDDGAGTTFAAATLAIAVQAAPAPAPTPVPQAAPAPPAKPASLAAPRVKRSGRTLVCDPGRWSGATAYAYRWLADGKRTGGAGARLTITRRLRHHGVRCGVTATGAGGSATALSAPLRIH